MSEYNLTTDKIINNYVLFMKAYIIGIILPISLLCIAMNIIYYNEIYDVNRIIVTIALFLIQAIGLYAALVLGRLRVLYKISSFFIVLLSIWIITYIIPRLFYISNWFALSILFMVAITFCINYLFYQIFAALEFYTDNIIIKIIIKYLFLLISMTVMGRAMYGNEISGNIFILDSYEILSILVLLEAIMLLASKSDRRSKCIYIIISPIVFIAVQYAMLIMGGEGDINLTNNIFIIMNIKKLFMAKVVTISTYLIILDNIIVAFLIFLIAHIYATIWIKLESKKLFKSSIGKV